MAESLKGKVAVITGVGSGFGKATAELFAAVDQVGLVLIDFNEKALKATADACTAAGSKVVALAADVTKPETFERALQGNARQLRQGRFPHQLCGRRAQGGAHRGDGRRHQPAHHRPEPHQHDHELPDLHTAVQAAGLRQDHQRVQRMRPPLVAGVVGLLRGQGRPSTPSRKCLYTELRPHGIAVTLLVPGGSNTGFQAAAAGVNKFEWDEDLAVRPEHFADMVYQTCALTRGGCVSEMLVYGLAQDVSGF